MEVSIHLRNLENLCRICCQKLDKTRRCKELVYFKKVLLEYFDVDVETDTPDVYPTCVCERCRKVLSKVEKFSKKNIVSTALYPDSRTSPNRVTSLDQATKFFTASPDRETVSEHCH